MENACLSMGDIFKSWLIERSNNLEFLFFQFYFF